MADAFLELVGEPARMKTREQIAPAPVPFFKAASVDCLANLSCHLSGREPEKRVQPIELLLRIRHEVLVAEHVDTLQHLPVACEAFMANHPMFNQRANPNAGRPFRVA